MEEITLSRHIKIRNHSDLCVVHTHCRKLRYAPIGTDSWVIDGPVRLVSKIVVRVRVRVQVGDEGDDPVLHVLGDGDVVGI